MINTADSAASQMKKTDGSTGNQPSSCLGQQSARFPALWSLGWMLDDDYKKAGFIMLPTGNRDKKTALQIILYTLWLIIISVFPATGLTGLLMISLESATIILVLGLIMLFMGINLYNLIFNVKLLNTLKK